MLSVFSRQTRCTADPLSPGPTYSLCIDECQFIINKNALSSVDDIIFTFSDCTFTSFLDSSHVGDKMSSEGHSGSFHQSLWFNKSAAGNPPEAQSAELIFVGTYFQLLA